MSARTIFSHPSLTAEPISVAKTATIIIGLLGTCVVLGYGVSHEPLIAGALVAVCLGAILLALSGVERFAMILLATLPWLVLLIDLTPALTLTFASAAATLLLLYLTPLRSEVSITAWIGASLFLLVVVIQVIESTTSGQLAEAAKYSLFPAIALVVSSQTSRRRLVRMRPLLLGSGVVAMAIQAAAIALHLGKTGAYYGAGEQLGLSPESPHEMALIGVMIAVACLICVPDIRWRVAGAAVAATPALATGVRSALVALVVSLLVLAIRARFRPSTVLSIAVIFAVVIFSGVGTIILTRYHNGQMKGEYSSLSDTGSGRGAILPTLLKQWSTGGPVRVAIGTSRQSIELSDQQIFGNTVTAQSDLVETLVELGLLGLFAWLLIWLAIVRSGISWLVLLPLFSYALTNGSLQYVGAVVYGIALAGACTPASRLNGSAEGRVVRRDTHLSRRAERQLCSTSQSSVAHSSLPRH